jgi:hypothetical protein
MNHPEGRLLAIQQQIHFANLLGETMEMSAELVLKHLSFVGMRLVTDENEIALDAAAVLPKLNNTKPNLRQV